MGMREALKALKSKFTSSPRRPFARTHLPEIFSKGEEEQTSIFTEIGEIISAFERSESKTQRKLSRKEWGKKNLSGAPNSIFFLKAKNGEYRYFLVPRKKGEDLLGFPNPLGKGGQGVVVAGYELKKDQENRWSIDPKAKPTAAIKISRPIPHEKLEKKRAQTQKEVDIATRHYKEKIHVYPEAFERSSKEKIKIYEAIDYLPGRMGSEFCGLYLYTLEHIQNSPFLSHDQKDKYLLMIFLESLNYCLKIIEAVELAHKQDILLIDTKSSNIILNNAEVTLIDFGVSEISSPDLKVENHKGTPLFAAPETLEPVPQFSKNSDKYSLGVTLYHFLGGDESRYSKLKLRAASPSVATPPAANSDNAKPIKTPPKISAKTKKLAAKGPNRVERDFLTGVPIEQETKDNLKQAIQNLLSVDPKDRPSLAEVKQSFLSAQAEATAALKTAEKKIHTDLKQQFHKSYLKLYPNKKANDEGKGFSKKESDSDFMNFLCWKINQPEFQTINRDFQVEVLNQIFGILKGEPEHSSLEQHIQNINTKVKEYNQKNAFITRWQFYRIYEDYEKKKDSFLGFRWLTQSVESDKAIRTAIEAKTPEARHQALISDYLEKKPRTSFLFFPAPKENSKRALGESIIKFRPTA